ncbi:DUF1080 domain-containing protein [Nonomuraea sp. NPDC059194]|uniref:3-keto-disaccharide hydrolase n=1 Tax=Nonomuraea sp. NPDC059194 TaxID=3346764 RepID=UPI0036CEA214
MLLDGTDMSVWRMVYAGRFQIVDGALQAIPGNGLGLLWCTRPLPTDFSVRLQYRLTRLERGRVRLFPRPHRQGLREPAWVAAHFGFEAQIDDLDWPDGADMHRTGTIYGATDQTYTPVAARPPGKWNDYEIRVRGQDYTVLLNGQQVTTFANTNSSRRLPTTSASTNPGAIHW